MLAAAEVLFNLGQNTAPSTHPLAVLPIHTAVSLNQGLQGLSFQAHKVQESEILTSELLEARY